MCASRIAEQQPAHRRERRAVELSAREAERHQAAGPPPDGRKNRPCGPARAGASEHRRDCHAVTTAATIEIPPLATASRSPPLTSRLLGSGGAPCRTGERRGHPMTDRQLQTENLEEVSEVHRETVAALGTADGEPQSARRGIPPERRQARQRRERVARPAPGPGPVETKAAASRAQPGESAKSRSNRLSSRPRARRRPLRPCSSSSSVVADGPLALSGLLDDPGEPYRPVQGLLYGQIDVPHGRLGSLVQVAVHANRAWRALT